MSKSSPTIVYAPWDTRPRVIDDPEIKGRGPRTRKKRTNGETARSWLKQNDPTERTTESPQ